MRRKDIKLAILMALVVGFSLLVIYSCDNPQDPVDNDNPTVTITNPVDASHVPNSVDVRAEASDNEGVDKVEFFIDGVLHYTDNYAPWACLWTTTTDDSGEHTIYAKAYDAAGNSAQSAAVSVICENMPPADVTDLAATEPTATGSLTLSWTAPGDDGTTGTAGLYDVRFYWEDITDENWASATPMTGEPEPQVAGSSESFHVTGLRRSTTYHFAMKTQDADGNWSGISNNIVVTTPDMFGTPATYEVGANANFMIAADMNDDGYDDLIVTHLRDTNNLSILYGIGDGTFQDPTVLYARRGPSSVSAADFDGSGTMDLVATNYVPNYSVPTSTMLVSKVTRLLQEAGGVFNIDTLYKIDTGFYWCISAPSWTFCQLSCWILDTTEIHEDHNEFGCPNYDVEVVDTTINYFYAHDSAYASCPIDVDNDGDMDLVVANEGDANFSLMINDGNGNFANPVRYDGLAKPVTIRCADFDGDGYLDVAMNIRSTTGVILVYRNLQNGTFADYARYSIGPTSLWMDVADIDGDGDQDIITACYGNNTISVLKNTGNGTFGSQWIYNVSRGPSAVVAVDLSGNGALDMAVASADEDHIAILFNEDPFAFYSFNTVTFGVGDGPGAIASGDFDGDGDNDIAVLNELSANISVLLNRTIE